ncbi:MAG: ThuA domain-containing protein [Actinomycetota bacterium]|nr:ThuA domain-containing protein [Actinomycetota bacterium]MEE3186007.1 ThuA domain-containing protein [Actinomycetota bacterium]
MPRPKAPGVHLVVGGFPPGSTAGHDMHYARSQLLSFVGEIQHVQPTISSNFSDLATWLPTSQLLVTYTSGPFPSGNELVSLNSWLERGGRWLALHGTSGGKAEPVDGDRRRRRMVKMPHHETLGAFFLNHPPIRRFTVNVRGDHPVVHDMPESFETIDELYFIEVLDPHATILLSTELPEDPDPGFGFEVVSDTSLMEDGLNRALGIVCERGNGAVAYLALGHAHSPATNSQPYVDTSVVADTATPQIFRGSWETEGFNNLVRNGVRWGLST